jgi:hypothetical protein
MRRDYTERSVSALAALLLLAVFALGILWVLLSGAGAYRRLTQRDAQSYENRTCAQYVVTRLRQAAGAQAVSLSSFGEGDALLITEQVDGQDYVTRIYCYDGWLRELFAADGLDFAPEDGEKVLQASQLSLSREGDLITARLLDGNGEPVQLQVFLRGGEGEKP